MDALIVRSTLTLREEHLLTCPSIEQPYCCICGRTVAIEQHHVVHRSHTMKRKDRGPTISLCKRCHMTHHSVTPFTFDYVDEWLCNGSPCITREVDPA